MGYLLEYVSASSVKDVIDVLSPVELLAVKQKDHMFVAAHYEELEKLTSPSPTYSTLRLAIKAHIKSELLILTALKVIQKANLVVTFIKTSGFNDKLEAGSLKQEVETRWMSLLNLFKSFFPSAASELPRLAKINQVS